jgi:hypothetical protein
MWRVDGMLDGMCGERGLDYQHWLLVAVCRSLQFVRTFLESAGGAPSRSSMPCWSPQPLQLTALATHVPGPGHEV